MTEESAAKPDAAPHAAVWISLLIVNGQVVHVETRPAVAPKLPKPKAKTPIVAPRVFRGFT